MTSEISSQSVLVAGQQLSGYDDRPITKVNTNTFHRDGDGVIILAALRRRSGNSRRKYKKVIEVTTDKTLKVTTEKVVVKATTEPALRVSTKEAVRLTDQNRKSITKVRRNELTNDGNDNPLWVARKRITRPPKSVPTKKAVKVIVVDEEDYSIRRARYFFTQRSGK